MARFDGRPTRFDWTHVKGTDSKVVATFLDVSSVAVDLSGRTITAVAYAPGTVATAFALTTALSGADNNVLTITVPDDATLPTELKADGTLDWALTVDFATGEVVSVVAGSFWIVNPGSPDSYSSSAAIDVTVSTAGPVAVTVTTLAAGPGLPTGGTTGQSLLKASDTNYDVVFGTASGTGDLLASANLSDVASAATSRTNLGLGTGDTPDLAITNMTLSDASLVVVDTTNMQTFADGVDDALLKARGTGVSSSYVSTVAVGGTTFAQPAVVGEIHSDEGFFNVSYAGATGITVGNLAASSTYVYVDNAGALQQQTTIPTRQDWSRKIFTMRIAVNTSTNLIIGFEYLNNPLGHYANSIRDVYTFLLAQGVPFKIDQTITGRGADLGFDVSAGTLLEFGGTGDIDNANIKSLDAVANAEYALMSRTAVVSSGNTDLVKFWDNAGTITALGSTTLVGHRLYRFSNGNFALQYGQGNYANMILAKAGVLTENYVLNPLLANATFFGWWFIESTATNTGGTTLTDFVEYTIGVQGGSSAELSGALLKGNNLSDVLDAATARGNLLAAPLADPTFTGDVVVPDATADGEALAYAQDDAVLQGLMVTKSAVPEYTLYELGEAADKGRWRIAVSGSDLYIQQMTDVGGFIKSPIIFNRDDVTDLSGSTAVAVPVPTTTGHALRWGSDAEVAALTAAGPVSIQAPYAALNLETTVTGQSPRIAWGLQSQAHNPFILEYYDNGTPRLTLRVVNNATNVLVCFPLQINETDGAVSFAGAPSVAVPDATAATHAVNRQTGDARYAPLTVQDVAWPQRDDMVGLWDFQESAEPYRSSSGVGDYPLTNGAGSTVTRQTDGAIPDGPFGPGLLFDGSTDYLALASADVGALNVARTGDAVTVCAWVRLTDTGSAFVGGMWQEDDADPRRQYGLFTGLGTYGGASRVCGHVSLTGDSSPSIPYSRDYSATGRAFDVVAPLWRFVAFTYDGTEAKSYLDGATDEYPDYTEPGSPNGQSLTYDKNPYAFDLGLNRTTVSDFTVGAVNLTAGFNNFLAGTIGGLVVYRAALTSAQIMQIHLATQLAGDPFVRLVDYTDETSSTSAGFNGWKSYLGSSATDTTAGISDNNFAFVRNDVSSYFYRSYANVPNRTNIGIGVFDTVAGLRLSQLESVKFKVNNTETSDVVRLCLKVAGNWYATDATYAHATGGGTLTNWPTNAEEFDITIVRTAASWRDLTLTPGSALTLDGSVRTVDLPNGELQGVGIYSPGIAGTLRVGDIRMYSF